MIESSKALGIWETARAVLVQMLSYKPEKDNSFDRRFGTDTASSVNVEELDIADGSAKRAAVFYVSAPPRLTRHMIETLPIKPREFDFVDFGCGKGRVLMVASEFPFRCIRGIEISRSLCSVAEQNLRIFRSTRQQCMNFEILCMDARNYSYGAENTVFHFYHPFRAELLGQVLANIRTTFHGTGKRAFVLYVWSGLTSLFPLFQECGFEKLQYIQTANPRYQFVLLSLSPKMPGIIAC